MLKDALKGAEGLLAEHGLSGQGLALRDLPGGLGPRGGSGNGQPTASGQSAEDARGTA